MIFRFEVDTTNAAFDGSLNDVKWELSRQFQQTMERFYNKESGWCASGGPVLDVNGNTVGQWSYESKEES